jgi:hypothetical protein
MHHTMTGNTGAEKAKITVIEVAANLPIDLLTRS